MDRPNSQTSQTVEADAQWTPAGVEPGGLCGEPAPQIYDCWNTIGVSGNGSCRELTRFIHCRNCPVYSAAAAQLLDRPVTPEHRREWTEHFAREKKLSTPARTSVVIFRIGTEWLALPTPAFQEVAERRTMHTLPHRRHGVVLGLVNIRGELLICASVSRLLGLETPAARPRSLTVYERLLVTNWNGHRMVIPVDEVYGIRHVHQDEFREAPATVARSARASTSAIFPWRDRTVGLLDADVLFTTLDRNLT